MKRLLFIIFFVGSASLCAMDAFSIESVEAMSNIDALRVELATLAQSAEDLLGNDFLTHAKKLSLAKDVVRPKIIRALTRPVAGNLGGDVADVLAIVRSAPPFGKSVLDVLPNYAQLIKKLLNPPVCVQFATVVASTSKEVGCAFDDSRAEPRPVSPSVLHALEGFARLRLTADLEDFADKSVAGQLSALLGPLTGYGLRPDVEALVQKLIAELNYRVEVGTCDGVCIAAIADQLYCALGGVSVRAALFHRLDEILPSLEGSTGLHIVRVELLIGILRELLHVLPYPKNGLASRWPAIRSALHALVAIDFGDRYGLVTQAELRLVSAAVEALREAAALLDVHLPAFPL